MRIAGEWYGLDDGTVIPIVRPKLATSSGDQIEFVFLVDTGADHTVLTAEAVRTLGLEAVPAPILLGGIGGTSDAVMITTAFYFAREDGTSVRANVQCYASTVENALGMSVIGRDILDHFSVIVDYPGKVVCLLAGRHRYVIQEA